MVRLQRLVQRTFEIVRNEPDPQTAARTITRSTRIVGRMLERMGQRRKPLASPGRMIARVGRVLWGLVEIAAPQSLGNILGQHWLSLLYALGLLMVMVGWIVDATTVMAAGGRVIAFAILVNLVVFALNRWMQKRSRRVVWLLFAISLGSTIALGAWIHLGPDAEIRRHSGVNFANARAGQVVTPARAVRILGPDASHGNLPNPDSVKALRDGLRLDWLFIPSYTLLILTVGLLLRKFQMFAGIAVGLALSDILENEQALRTIDAAEFPQAFYLKLGFAAAAVLLTVWMLVRRLVRTIR